MTTPQAVGVLNPGFLINEGLYQVNKVIRQNSAISGETSAASDELSSQAQLVKEMLLQCKLKDDYEGLEQQDSEPENPLLGKSV